MRLCTGQDTALCLTESVTYRPVSNELDAMGEISECMLMMPSSGLSSGGLTIFASMNARTLHACQRTSDVREPISTNRVLPNSHSTQPNAGPKVKFTGRISRSALPSMRMDCCSAESANSRSGIEGEGGRMVVNGKVGIRLWASCYSR